MNNKWTGQAMLLGAAIIWGSSFIVMKDAVDFLPPATLLAVRFALATVFISVIFFKQVKATPLKHYGKGFLVGCCLFFAYYLQTTGLTMTTPGKNAFLTAVYCMIVPFLVWVFYRKKPDVYQLGAALLCIIGIGLVSLQSDFTIQPGDLYTLAGGCFYALHMVLVKRYVEYVTPTQLTALQFGFCAIVAGVVGICSEDFMTVTTINSTVGLQLFYLAFFATMIALLLQNMGQEKCDACMASILLSLESVFGVVFSVLFGYEAITMQVTLGFTVIFFAILLSETKLSFLKKEKIS